MKACQRTAAGALDATKPKAIGAACVTRDRTATRALVATPRACR